MYFISSQSINELGMISLIVYLLNTSVTFIHVLIRSFRYSAPTIQDPSDQLPLLHYFVHLLSDSVFMAAPTIWDPVIVSSAASFTTGAAL